MRIFAVFNKRRPFASLVAGALAATLLLTACGGSDGPEDGGEAEDYDTTAPLALGWNPTTVPLNQFGNALQRTNIPELWGLDLKVTQFLSAAEMTSALAAGSIDAYWSSDGPLGGVAAKGVDLTIFGSNVGWIQAFAVSDDGDIQGLADLKGKKVGVHEGSTTSLYARTLVEAAGVDRDDVEWVNTPITSMAAVMATGDVDAVFGWSPTILTIPGTRVLEKQSVGIGSEFPGTVFAAKNDFTSGNRETIIRFLAAVMHANWWAVQNADVVNDWYAEDYTVDPALLQTMLDAEPLWTVTSPQDLDYQVSPEHIAQMTATAKELTGEDVDFSELVDNELIAEATRRFQERIESLDVEVTKP